MKILVLGAYDSSNLGDPVICDCVAGWLRDAFPGAEILIKDVLPRRVGGTPSLKALQRRRQRTRLTQLAARAGVDLVYVQYCRWIKKDASYIARVSAIECDAVVVAGGQLFMDRYTLYLDAYVKHFARQGIPVFVNACGIGPAHSRKIAARLRAALQDKCVKYVSCRDDVAQVKRRYTDAAVETWDPALSAGTCYGISPVADADTVGLGVICNQAVSEAAQTRFWLSLIPELDRQNIHWQFFTNGDPADEVYARKLLRLLGRQDSCLRPRDTKPAQLVGTVAQYRSLISFRLHSHIIAASLGIPTVAVVWDQKLPYFFKKIGFPERCVYVDSGPDHVIAVLKQAQSEGYDRQRLQAQEAASRDQLITAIRRELQQGRSGGECQ